MRPALAVVIMVASVGCGGSPSTPSAPSPSAPGASPAPGGTFILSGMVFELSPTGRRPIVGATVEIAESTFGDINTRPTTDLNGRYAFNGLTPRHYLARASKTGYDMSSVVNLGFVEKSRIQDFELVPTGSAAPLSIATVEPSSGSTGGGTSMVITGTGFRTGSTVTFGGERVTALCRQQHDALSDLAGTCRGRRRRGRVVAQRRVDDARGRIHLRAAAVVQLQRHVGRVCAGASADQRAGPAACIRTWTCASRSRTTW